MHFLWSYCRIYFVWDRKKNGQCIKKDGGFFRRVSQKVIKNFKLFTVYREQYGSAEGQCDV